jgi:DNA-binding FadR family transcriptional regulator
MQRKLRFTPTAAGVLKELENNPAFASILRQVRKTLGYLETNPRHNSLQTHKHIALSMRYKKEIFEAYAQQNTSAAYRVFWRYEDDEKDNKENRIPVITVIAITPHPD